ncbi:hypothetical protein [Lentilactobacillus kosonis]|uniref:Uncharacterized protein n=1 Tax=Lentilactobacillus kosonis TaxID=2810561 RepID=A0A401FNX1_9LACO|nr:hypothetical protein [Lentilactobacillus kosonis]GAY74080.1 hypothetical protein NBRC111893_2226 [Lentilactobacillus kosonis]
MNNDQDEPGKLTRKQYRELKDGKRPKRDESNSGEAVPPVSEQPIGRNKPENVTREDGTDYKTPRWHRINRRLNIAMGILIALIIIVYLILIFIN